MSGQPHLQDPWYLLLLLLVPILVARRHQRQGFGELTYSSLPLSTGGSWRLHLPFYLRLLALVLLIVAFARPQLGWVRERNMTEGIDIQVVLDVSGSMAAEDFQPRNRLTVAKDVMREFVDRRHADRIGLVIFAGNTLTRAPLTADHQVLRLLLDSIELNTLPDGTAIGMALAAGAARLKSSEAATRVIVLVTDGVNNSGAIDPDTAAALCEGLGIKVYTVGVGTAGRVQVPVPMSDASGRVETQRVEMDVEVDEELLRSIAERTGGRFFQAVDADSLREVFADIDRLEKTPLEIQRYVRYREAFEPLVVIAAGLLLLPLALAFLGLTAEP